MPDNPKPFTPWRRRRAAIAAWPQLPPSPPTPPRAQSPVAPTLRPQAEVGPIAKDILPEKRVRSTMKKPLSPKLAGGSIGANISVVFLWLLNTYVQINPPGEVKASIAGLFAAAGVWAARSE